MTKYLNKYLDCINIKLPEEVAAYRGAGLLEDEKKAIDRWLDKNISQKLRGRLILEREWIERIFNVYPYTKEEALKIVRDKLPDFSEEDLEVLEHEGVVEWTIINGTKHYIANFFRTMIGTVPKIHEQLGDLQEDEAEQRHLKYAIKKMKEKGEIAYRFTISSQIGLNRMLEETEMLTAHIPIPAEVDQISEIVIEKTAGDVFFVDHEKSRARSITFKGKLEPKEKFEVVYSYTSRVKYVDAYNRFEEAILLEETDIISENLERFLRQEEPHIIFSEYIKELSEEIVGDEKNPLLIARKIYDFITTKIRYSYMRDYFFLPNIPEYCGINGRGDCGVQSLLFITLCRLNGIPARWQSGLYTVPECLGAHDWAMFYVKPFGWIFADPSFGGDAFKKEDEDMRQFYFGNVDPYRMVANTAFMEPLNPDVIYRRYDPYDNQLGEIEAESHGFIDDEVVREKNVINMVEV